MNIKLRGAARAATVLTASALTVIAADVAAQEQEQAEITAPSSAAIEEVVATGRQRSVATDVVQERIEQEVVADFLGIDQISRVGDSTVSAALRRLPGVTLVQGKFIYVRGLGERYSSTTLNGAYVPSPDLTRNVIPLDLFPTSILDSLAVSKGFSPDLPAAFGGGSVDIRTSGIPELPFLQFEIGTGMNTVSSNVLSYPGGDDDRWGTDDGTRALSDDLLSGIYRYRGNISPANILAVLQEDGGNHTIAEANLINRQLATELNRNVDLSEGSADPDLDLSASGGSTWYFGDADAWGFGLLGLVDYGSEVRNKNRRERGATPATRDVVISSTQRSVQQTDLTLAVTSGIKWFEDHALEAMYLYLRNSEDEATLRLANNTNAQPGSGVRLRTLGTRFEERELTVQQLRGEHTLGPDSLELLGEGIDLGWLEGLRFNWYLSDSEARTDIPNETSISAIDTIDPTSGAVTTEIRATASAADFRFTDLIDDVSSSGWALEMPFLLGEVNELELALGQDVYQKGRRYLQTQLGLGTTAGGTETLRTGEPSVVFSDANLVNPDNGFFLNLGGIGTESYLAAESVTATFGSVDWTWNQRWRVVAGARHEDYKQFSVPVDQYDFSANKIPVTAQQLPDLVTATDEVYPSLALTYMAQDFWADDFQLRLNYSQTATRPDLREVTDSVFIDPFTDFRIQGNPGLRPSELSNYDLRAEWFFFNGDSFSATLFYKDIERPIETVEGAGSEDNVVLSFINAESAKVSGVELESYVSLGHLADLLGDWTEAFFVSGNLTIADSEITIGSGSGFNATNNTRPLTQSSEYAFNVQLGYDSFDGMHSASLAFNTFGERVFFAGRGGAPDAYEQPFNSLDLTYSWFPTELLTIKLKAQNLLEEETEIERGGIITRTQEVGTSFGLSAKYKF